mmetsp:Transcript_16833/g.50272  ORF Transcript_16833/g.50272 Transcript_16833/m.50272 type:complete len:229 (+) Transcript_16833:88-774(+)
MSTPKCRLFTRVQLAMNWGNWNWGMTSSSSHTSSDSRVRLVSFASWRSSRWRGSLYHSRHDSSSSPFSCPSSGSACLGTRSCPKSSTRRLPSTSTGISAISSGSAAFACLSHCSENRCGSQVAARSRSSRSPGRRARSHSMGPLRSSGVTHRSTRRSGYRSTLDSRSVMRGHIKSMWFWQMRWKHLLTIGRCRRVRSSSWVKIFACSGSGRFQMRNTAPLVSCAAPGR